jgi:hypothetical protein
VRLEKCLLLVAAACIATLTAPERCHAVVLNDAYFTASGGNVNNVAGTLDAGYSAARAYSYSPQFLSVGTLGFCTATWLGNDISINKSYFLTAAHCCEGSPPAPKRNLNVTFTGWNGEVVASGPAVFHLPPERVHVPPGYGGASTDIGILEMPGLAVIRDAVGRIIERPLLYDGGGELGAQNSFVGYGSWGIGSQGSNGGLFPSSGPRRAGATNKISSIFEANHGLGAAFNAPGTGDATPAESSVASGDSGSAWWQQHAGRWTIVGVTNGGSGTTYGTVSTASRVSGYVDWIRSIYPVAQLYSEDLNSVDADINGDRVVSSPGDTSAFIARWRQRSLPNGPNQADLNQDGLVNLPDAYLLHNALSTVGQSFDFSLLTTPEPSSMALWLALLGWLPAAHRNRASAIGA